MNDYYFFIVIIVLSLLQIIIMIMQYYNKKYAYLDENYKRLIWFNQYLQILKEENKIKQTHCDKISNFFSYYIKMRENFVGKNVTTIKKKYAQFLYNYK